MWISYLKENLLKQQDCISSRQIKKDTKNPGQRTRIYYRNYFKFISTLRLFL